jgi:hypothetical protein
MNELEKIQKLHQSSVNGEALTAEENATLQEWYVTLDREEDLTINEVSTSQSWQDHLAGVTKQVAKISREIETIVSQNAVIRDENQVLRKTFESRLLEKAA